jgi:hypothetical protein
VMLALSLAQELVEDDMRGRLLGAVHMGFRLGLALGALGIGGLASLIEPFALGIGGLRVHLDGNQVGLIVGGGVILAGAVIARGVTSARIREAKA